MKIAVFLDNNNKTISFDEAGVVKIYSKDKEEWNVIKEIPFSIINLSSTRNS
jgi:Iron only nitrogenase protein AnfO (AnfO_nitrog).